jgi:hypothetical protein
MFVPLALRNGGGVHIHDASKVLRPVELLFRFGERTVMSSVSREKMPV